LQAVEQAVKKSSDALKRIVTADAMQLLRQVSDHSQKHIVSMDDAIGATRRRLESVNELRGAVKNVLESGDVGQLVGRFRILRNSASDIIEQHEQHKLEVVYTRCREYFRCGVPLRLTIPQRGVPCFCCFAGLGLLFFCLGAKRRKLPTRN